MVFKGFLGIPQEELLSSTIPGCPSHHWLRLSKWYSVVSPLFSFLYPVFVGSCLECSMFMFNSLCCLLRSLYFMVESLFSHSYCWIHDSRNKFAPCNLSPELPNVTWRFTDAQRLKQRWKWSWSYLSEMSKSNEIGKMIFLYKLKPWLCRIVQATKPTVSGCLCQKPLSSKFPPGNSLKSRGKPIGKPMMDLEPPFPHISWKTSHFYALFFGEIYKGNMASIA